MSSGEVIAIITGFGFGVVVASSVDSSLSCSRSWGFRRGVTGTTDCGCWCHNTAWTAPLLVSSIGTGPEGWRCNYIRSTRRTIIEGQLLSLNSQVHGRRHLYLIQTYWPSVTASHNPLTFGFHSRNCSVVTVKLLPLMAAASESLCSSQPYMTHGVHGGCRNLRHSPRRVASHLLQGTGRGKTRRTRNCAGIASSFGLSIARCHAILLGQRIAARSLAFSWCCRYLRSMMCIGIAPRALLGGAAYDLPRASGRGRGRDWNRSSSDIAKHLRGRAWSIVIPK